ncbi:unnamed protein product [Moneuplotes crassus]|uniref:Uncharacterized protein n=1 Tax=Euplotes crassus TaxID=5936 RepID=A0AAD1XU31_EUPCR|nr:unnamed protein product [Moneuplotes crassus]
MKSDFTEYESTVLSSSAASIVVLRTSLTIEGVDFYREAEYISEDKIFISPVYLQEKTLNITNVNFNVTGRIIRTYDPLNVHLQNISFDSYRISVFYSDIQTLCNYPEAYLFPEFNVTGITHVLSQPKVILKSPKIFILSGPGNITISSLDLTDYFITKGEDILGIGLVVSSGCLPQDGNIQFFNVNGMKSDLTNYNDGSQFIFHAFSGMLPHSRRYKTSFVDTELKNFRFAYEYAFFNSYSTQVDTFEIRNFYAHNGTFSHQLGMFVFNAEVSLVNCTLSNITEVDAFLQFTYNQKVSIDGLTLINYSTKAIRYWSDIEVSSSSYSQVIISGLLLINCSFKSKAFIDMKSNPSSFQFLNSRYEDTQIDGDISIVSFNSISAFSIANHSFDGISVSQQGNSENALFRVSELKLVNSLVTVKDISMSDSDLSLFSIDSVSADGTDREIVIENLSIKNSYIESPRVIVATTGFKSTDEVRLIFNNVNVDGIRFKNVGSIFQFSHRLNNPIVVQNSIFQDLSSANIMIEGSGDSSSDLDTAVILQNCTFTNIVNPKGSLIEITGRGSLQILSSNFTQITSTGVNSGVILVSESSEAFINDCSFSNNSALASSVFKIISEGAIICTQCEVSYNFALQSGVFEVDSSGRISFVDAEIHHNYGIQNSIGHILETMYSSEFSNCSIHHNTNVDNEVVTNAVKGNCEELCMISQTLIGLLGKNPSMVTNIVPSIYSLDVVTGLIEIRHQTRIFEQPLFLNAYLSGAKFSNCSITSVTLTRPYLFATSSNITLDNMEIHSALKNEIGIIVETLDSIVSMSNISYSESDCTLLLALSTEVYLYNLSLTNIQQANDLIRLARSPKGEINNINIVDSSSKTDRVIMIELSTHLIIRSVNASKYQKTFLRIQGSHIGLIENLHVVQHYRGLELVNTQVALIANSTFIGSGSYNLLNAGAVYILQSNVTFSNTSFIGNKAMTGGAIASLCTSASHCFVNVKNCTFTNNIAIEKGGAIYYNYRPPYFDEYTILANNSAKYGENIASYPVMVAQAEQHNSSKIKIEGVSSGIIIEQPLVLNLVDGNGQVMLLDSSSQMSIQARSSNSSIKGINVVKVQNGSSKFDSLIAVAQPGRSNVKYSILSKSINEAKVNAAFGGSIVQPDIVVDFTFCKPGEQTIGSQCSECPAGTYSFIWNSTQCHACEDNAACLGKQKMEIAKGYWRNSLNSTKIVECIQQKACNGGYHPENIHPVQCAEGYTGKLCSKCSVTKDKKYHKISDFECQVCPSPVLNSLRVFALILLVFVFFMILIITNIRKTSESQLSILMRIMTSYLQIITTSMSMTTKYPSSLADIFVPINRIGDSSQAFVSFDCFITGYEIEEPFGSNAVLKLFLMLLLPLTIFLVVTFIWIVILILNRRWVTDLKRNLVISFISILFILHPKLTESSINAFRCISFEEESYAARIDTDLVCYSFDHLKWCILISLPILIIWVIGFPTFALVMLYKAKKAKNERILGYFLILYQGLKDNIFYWEFINTLRKFLVVVCFLLPTNYKIALSMIIMIISERVETYLQPYKLPENNTIEILAIVAGIVTLNAGYVYEQNEEISNLNLVVLVVVVSINAKFILEWIYRCIESFQARYKPVRKLYLCFARVLCKKPNTEIKEQRAHAPQNKSLYEAHQVKILSEQKSPKKATSRHKRRIKVIKGYRSKRKTRRSPRKLNQKQHEYPAMASSNAPDRRLNSISSRSNKSSFNLVTPGLTDTNANRQRLDVVEELESRNIEEDYHIFKIKRLNF